MAEANEQEQMEMAFLDDGLERDPVSGNEIPTGSLAEEVRDDVPAMLSEGEYVVPADVLRFYGIKFFEDLRIKAKDGLARMESMGRIGGEPIEEESAAPTMPTSEDSNVLPFPVEELETEEEEIQMAVGGVINAQEGITVSTVPDELTTGEGGFRQVQYWNGQDESTIFTATFIGDVSISHSPTQLAGYVPYVPQADEGKGGDEGDSSSPKETREERIRRRDREKFKDRFEKQEEITKELYPEGFGSERIAREPKEIFDYAKQLKGYGPLNIGIDDIVTKIPGIGDLTSALLSKQHKDILEDAAELYNNKEVYGNLSDEQKSTLDDLIAGEGGLTPAKSLLFKGKELVGSAIKPKKDKKDKKPTAAQQKVINDAAAKIDKSDAEAFEDLNKGGLMRKGKK